MAWARFVKDFDYRTPGDQTHTIAYLAGMRCSVPRACLDQAKAVRAAVEIRTPHREHGDKLKADPFWLEG